MLNGKTKAGKMEKYMIATKAIHKTGDISRDDGDLCIVFEEDESNYIGQWVTGYGFVKVKFPKESTRPLTKKEIKKYNKLILRLPWGGYEKMKVD